MLTTTFNRPFAPTGNDLKLWQRINYRWWLIRLPMFLLAVPSAYGVGAFAAEKLPPEVALFAGLAFESAYIGAIAAADQLEDASDWITSTLWWCVNVAAVLASVAANLLYFSGSYAAITPESATHAIPLPVLGFFYGLMVHRVTSKSAEKAAQASQREEEDRQATRYGCSACAFRGHKGRSGCDGMVVDTFEK
jgi:hypothetical protein